jgi:hypothetical protein
MPVVSPAAWIVNNKAQLRERAQQPERMRRIGVLMTLALKE